MLYRLIKPCSTGEEPEEVMMGEVQKTEPWNSKS